MRGKKCSTNLYYSATYDEKLLNKTVGEIRALILRDDKQNTTGNYLSFALWCLIIILTALMYLEIAYLLVLLVRSWIP